MRIQDWRIQLKIVFPFTLLFLAAGLSIAVLSMSLLARTIENQVRAQVDRAASMISQSNFADNPGVLQLLKRVIGADIITYSETGETLAATLPAEAADLLKTIQSSPEAGRIFRDQGEEIAETIQDDAVTYRVAYRRLPARPNIAVALLVDMTEVNNTRAAIARTLFALTLLVALVTTWLSHLLARHITAPIIELEEASRGVAQGDLSHQAPVRGNDEVGRLAVAFNDMLQKLQESKDRLMQSERLAATGLLAAQVAHDVRNPLSAIKMQTQLLRGRVQPGPGNQEILQAVLRDVDRVEWVVKGLLELARPGELKLSTDSVNDIVSDVLRTIELQLRHRKVSVETHLDASVPAMPLDRDRLKQALLNVCLNASESMPNGGNLTVATALSAKKNETVIDVVDEGEGIDPSIRDRLFNPFASTKRDGIGLGLFSARSILERHGGTIQIFEVPARGTLVRMTLPLPTAEKNHG